MGWWGSGIMEGDDPLDAKGEILELLGFDYQGMDDDPTPEQICIALNEQQLTLLERFKEDEFDNFIKIQVLGFLIITTGAKLEKVVHEAIFEAIKNDDWTEEDRQHELTKFKNAVRNYYAKGGRPFLMTNEDMFRELFNSMGGIEVNPNDLDITGDDEDI